MESFIKDNIKEGKLARLIPSIADSKKEERATSSLLACFRIIPGFAQKVLSEVGAPIHKSSTITCFTEVVFNKQNSSNKKARPDGLIIVKTRKKIWTAIFESKVGNQSLTKDQIEEYLDIAKINNVDALITISNQYATIPTHHPIQVSKQKLKSTQLFHFSWMFIQTIATLISENKVVEDPEQAFILSEFIKYLEDPESGVTSFTQMGKGWKEICRSVNEGIKIKRNDSNLEDAISSWQQFSKYLSIKLSELVGQPVYEYISRSRTQDNKVNYDVNVLDLSENQYLDAEFEIPNAASRLHIIADFSRRTISIKMALDAPRDRKLPQACVTWLTRQISDLEDDNVNIRCNWNRGVYEMDKLSKVLEDPLVIVPKGMKELPKSIEVVEIIDMAGKFRSSKIFVDETTKLVLNYYKKVGQNLRKWTPKPLKVKSNEATKTKEIDQNEINPFWIPPTLNKE